MALPLISQFLAIEFKEARDDGRVKRRQRSRHGTTAAPASTRCSKAMY